MTTYFVSRHRGAIDWARDRALAVDVWMTHIDAACVAAGDVVAGTLPVHIAAAICDRGATYLHLTVDLPRQDRGRELSAGDLQQAGARLEPFTILRRSSFASSKTLEESPQEPSSRPDEDSSRA